MSNSKSRIIKPEAQPLKTPPTLFIPGERLKSTGVAHWYTQ